MLSQLYIYIIDYRCLHFTWQGEEAFIATYSPCIPSNSRSIIVVFARTHALLLPFTFLALLAFPSALLNCKSLTLFLPMVFSTFRFFFPGFFSSFWNLHVSKVSSSLLLNFQLTSKFAFTFFVIWALIISVKVPSSCEFMAVEHISIFKLCHCPWMVRFIILTF